jgi:sugar phosphate isomerase/epimerase
MKFLFKTVAVLVGLVVLTGCQSLHKTEKVLPRLGLQAWTFRSLTFDETLRTAERLGVHYLQGYPGQKLGGGLEGKFHHTMDAATQAKVLALLASTDVKLMSYGVVAGRDPAEWRQIFAFAKAMGIESIATEPKPETLAAIEPLAREFGIVISLHNHPTPSIYADPATALAAIKPFGRNVGLCADTGHWVRSGYDAVETLRRAEGRIVTVHFKDLNEVNVKGAHDVPWGTGASNAAGQLAELRRQQFGGVVLIEYEHNTPELEKNVSRCVEYFNRAMSAPLSDLVSGKVVPPGYTRTPDELWSNQRGKDSLRWPLAPPEAETPKT